jgi:hypothetical protein
VTFVDPKGIRNVGLQDPKISFYETVKDIEKRLGQPDVVLESFIVSNTPSHEMSKLWGITKGRDAEKTHPVSGGRQGYLHPHPAGDDQLVPRMNRPGFLGGRLV